MTFFFFTEGISETSKYFFCVVHYLSLCCGVLSPYPASSHPPRSALHVQVLQPCYQMQSSTLSLWKAQSPGATPHRALLFQPGKGRGKWEIGGKWAKHRMKWDLGSSWDRVVWSAACWDEILKEAFGGEKEMTVVLLRGSLMDCPGESPRPVRRSWVPWPMCQKNSPKFLAGIAFTFDLLVLKNHIKSLNRFR